MRHTVGAALAPAGLTGTDYGALLHLDTHPGTSNADCARFLIVTPQVLGRTLAALEEKGLVVRRPAPGAHRTELAITDQGRAVLNAAAPAVEAAQQRLLAPLTREEQTRFLAALTGCADEFENTFREDHS